MTYYKKFAGPEGACEDRNKSDIVILPVPYDSTSTGVKGADKGPFCLLEASEQLEMYDIEMGAEVFKRGIYTHPPVDVSDDPRRMTESVFEAVGKLADDGKFIVTIGGEHSVSIGAVRAHYGLFPGMSVLQLDAHADLRDEYEGSRFNHACVMSRIKETCPIVQAGIRSMSRQEKAEFIDKDMFFARDIMKDRKWVSRVVNRLSDNVYVTIDLDVFDLSIMPSTGTPQPGGLDWYQVTGLLKEVAKCKNIVGFDVVELCPQESNKGPDLLAAKLVYKFLSYIFADRPRG